MVTRAMELRAWLEQQAGYRQACARIGREAALLGISPLSDMAVRQAIATYHADTGRRPDLDRRPHPPIEDQESLL